MKYKIMRFTDASGCERDKHALFILPKGPGTLNFLVVYPQNLKRSLEDLIIHPDFAIRIFQGLSETAVEDVKERLILEIGKKLRRLINRGSNWFSAGIVIAVFGIINWVIPDPLPLVDEMVMTLGGAAAAIAGFNLRRRGNEEDKRKADIAKRDISSAEPQIDPVLTWFHKALKAKAEPGAEAGKSSGLDEIELESQWLTKYGNFEQLCTEYGVKPQDLSCFFRIIKSIFPFKKISSRRKKTIRRLEENIGISFDALMVYSALFEEGEEFLEELREGF